MSFISRTILFAAQLNAAFSTKADLDSTTGKVRADQLPDAAAIAHQALDASVAAAAALAQSAHDLASIADGHATAAGTAAATTDTHAGTAATAAAAAQAKADAAIPMSQKGVANGVASLGSDGKVPASQLPASTGGGGSGTTLTPPHASDFTWIGGGGCSAVDGDGGLWLGFPWIDQTAGNKVDGLKRAAPAAPYSLVVRTRRDAYDVPYVAGGVGWRDSSTGKLHLFMQGPVAAQANPSGTNAIQTHIAECRLANQTTFDNFRALPLGGADIWWKLEDDGSHRRVSFSRDGKRWRLFWENVRTDYLASPDQIVLVANLLQTGMVCPQVENELTVLHWAQS